MSVSFLNACFGAYCSAVFTSKVVRCSMTLFYANKRSIYHIRQILTECRPHVPNDISTIKIEMNVEKRSLTTGDEFKSNEYGPGSLSRAAAAFDSSSSSSDSDSESEHEPAKSAPLPPPPPVPESGPVSSVGHLSMMRAHQAFDTSDSDDSTEESDVDETVDEVVADENQAKTVQLNDLETRPVETGTFSPPMSLGSLARATSMLGSSDESSSSSDTDGDDDVNEGLCS